MGLCGKINHGLSILGKTCGELFTFYIVYCCNLLNLGVIYYLGVIYPSQCFKEFFRRIFFSFLV